MSGGRAGGPFVGGEASQLAKCLRTCDNPAPHEASLLQPGTLLEHGRYEIVKQLGSGAFATVYLARHTGLLSLHAVKILDDVHNAIPDVRNRFLAEGRIQAQLQHPGVVAVTDIVTDPTPGLVMQYISGPTLGEWITERHGAPATIESVLELFLPILEAVGAAHKLGIVHRDLKPENIIVATGGDGTPRPMVSDFGIAKVVGPGLDTGKKKTEAGMRMGTLQYMSPEQVRGSVDLDARSDIFALGAILYEVVTGQVAFARDSEYDTMKAIVEGRFAPPERFIVGGLPPVFAACIRKALATDPPERFQDCASFIGALRGAVDPTVPLPARPLRSAAITGGLSPLEEAPKSGAPTPRGKSQTAPTSKNPIQAPRPRPNSMATASAILGVGSLASMGFCCIPLLGALVGMIVPFTALAAIVTGILGRNSAGETGVGGSASLLGLVCGGVSLALYGLFFFFGVAASLSN